VTFAILAVLFVFLQGLGVLFGYRWGFAGQNSKAAFKALGKGKYLTYGDVRTASQQFIDKAQNQLENLQQRMIQFHAQEGTGKAVHPNKSFLDFLDDTDHQESEYRSKKRRAHQQEQQLAQEDHERHQALRGVKEAAPLREKQGGNAAAADAAAADAAAADAAAAAAAPAVAQSVRASEVDAAVRRIDSLGDDAQAKRAFIDTLPDAVFTEVKQVLQDRKQARDAARQQRAAEIEDLL
jgi:hypothetical protein